MKEKKTDTFLGIVERNSSIFIPWRGTHVYPVHNFEFGQNLLVEIKAGRAVKVELPTLEQLNQMQEELFSDWHRFAEIFKTAPMRQKVLMLRALDQAMRVGSWEN